MRRRQAGYDHGDVRCGDDNVLAQFAEGGLTAAERAGVEEHIDQCDECRMLLAGLAPGPDRAAPDDGSTVPRQPGRRDPSAPPFREPGDDNLPPGHRIGRYVVLRRLGAGGVGVVYAAHDPDLAREVAIKMLRAKQADRQARQRLLREARLAARLSHPNVVTVHDVGVDGERIYIVMEYVEGLTLRAWIKHAPRSLEQILTVFLAAGEGLWAAHRVGLVHRDFKPDNVLVGHDGRVRVTDFGLARPAAEGELPASSRSPRFGAEELTEAKLTRTGDLLGTPAYMAPEQMRGLSTDARTDQFSFCVALYEALFGQRPYPARDLGQLFQLLLSGAAPAEPPPSEVPAGVQAALRRGLSHDSDARFPDLPTLMAALREGAQPSAPAEPTVARLEPVAQRHALRRRLTMVVGAIVALLVTWLAGSSRSEPSPLAAEGSTSAGRESDAAAPAAAPDGSAPSAQATLVIRVTPSGAAVEVDGQAVPTSEDEARAQVQAGLPHRVQVTAAGFVPFEQRVTAQAGREVVLPVVLDRRKRYAGSDRSAPRGRPSSAPRPKPTYEDGNGLIDPLQQ